MALIDTINKDIIVYDGNPISPCHNPQISLKNSSPQINIKRQSPTGTDEISSFPNQVNSTSFPNEGLRRPKRVCRQWCVGT